MRRNREFDDEEWYDEDYDAEDFFEEDKLSFSDGNQRQKQPSAPIRLQDLGPISPPQRGPVVAPPPPTNTMPSISTKASPPTSGPPRSQTIQQSKPKSTAKKIAKKVKKSEENDKKVRRAVVEVEEDIFDNVPQSSIDVAIDELSNYSLDNERQLLMYLQEKGWNAPQSRAIINMAKSKSR